VLGLRRDRCSLVVVVEALERDFVKVWELGLEQPLHALLQAHHGIRVVLVRLGRRNLVKDPQAPLELRVDLCAVVSVAVARKPCA
jgi:hypothetical protein